MQMIRMGTAMSRHSAPYRPVRPTFFQNVTASAFRRKLSPTPSRFATRPALTVTPQQPRALGSGGFFLLHLPSRCSLSLFLTGRIMVRTQKELRNPILHGRAMTKNLPKVRCSLSTPKMAQGAAPSSLMTPPSSGSIERLQDSTPPLQMTRSLCVTCKA